MHVIHRNNLLFSILITAVLFATFLTLCAPIIDSDDNFYALYTLAGGYGQAPTHILHYLHIWNPFLFWPIAKLFNLMPGFNWYSGFLLTLQFIGCTHLLHLFLRLFPRWMALTLFLIFFLFFESSYLLSLNHTTTSFLLAISGCSSLLYHFHSGTKSATADFSKLIFPLCLLLVSGLLRLHTLGLYIVLTLGMGLIFLPFRHYKRMFLSLFLIGLVLLTFMAVHKFYYITRLPHFEREEQLRQSLFYLANHSTSPHRGDTGISRIKSSFIQSWFLYDTAFVTQKDIDHFSKKATHNQLRNTGTKRSILYWSFINSRVYLFLLALILFAFTVYRQYKVLIQWLLMSLPGVFVYGYLVLFMKVTESIFIAFLSSIFFSAAFCFNRFKLERVSFTPLLHILLILNTGWMLVRIYKSNDANLNEIKETRALLKEISTHPQFLFVNTDMDFRDLGFYIWDTPQQYPLTNLLNKELLVTNSYYPTFERFGIRDLMQELPYRSDILLFNRVDPLLKEYYLMQGINTELKVVPGFTTLTAYRIEAK